VDDLDSVMDILSEHMCHGRLEVYLRTGRPGVFNGVEGVVHIIDSMFIRHANWREPDLLATQRAEIIRGWTWAASR
jgi:xylulose-5-phosphate/fructose-6-phosphate phosphoketolase